MAISMKRYRALQEAVDRLTSKKDRAEGALETLMGRLEEEFDCTSLAEAKKKLARLQKERDAAAEAFEDKWEAFEKKWGHLADG